MSTSSRESLFDLHQDAAVQRLIRSANEYFGSNHKETEGVVKLCELSENERTAPRYNTRGTEFLCVLRGHVLINGLELQEGDILTIETGEIVELLASETSTVLSLITPTRDIMVHRSFTSEPDRSYPETFEEFRPLVTIVIIAKDIERYICHCIISCLNQTYPNLQLIVVDDGSKDNTAEKALAMAKFDSRLEILTTSLGVNGARSYGLERSKGDFNLIIDGDDWLSIDAIEQLLATVQEKSSDCIVFGFDHHSDTTRLIRDPVYPTDALLKRPPIYYSKDDNAAFQISHLNHTIWMYFFSAELRKHATEALVRQPLYEDLPFFIALIGHSERPTMCNLILYHYRRDRKGQATENWEQVKPAYKQSCLNTAVEHTLSLIRKDHSFYHLILIYKVHRIVQYERNISAQQGNMLEAEAWSRQFLKLMSYFDQTLSRHILEPSVKNEFDRSFTLGKQ